MKTLLITGGAGFIGSGFVAQAVAAGYRAIVLDALTYAGHRENLEWISPPLPSSRGLTAGSRAANTSGDPAVKPRDDEGRGGDGYQLIVGDIADGALVARLFAEHSFDAVVHFAAESHVDNSITSPAAFIQTNIVGTYTLLEAARLHWNNLKGEAKADFRFLQVSTDEVYGSLEEQGKFSEASPMRPNSPYSASKAAGDHLARAWFKTYGFPAIVTNCTNNYGPRQYPEKLIPHMITRALAGQSLPVYGDGKNVRDWIHVDDHCAGVLLALEKGNPGETYCFGGDAEMANIDLVKMLCTLLDEMKPRQDARPYEAQIAYVPDRPGHDRRYAMDDNKAQRELGFTRQYDFQSGLRATVKWYLDNQAWHEAVTRKAA